MPLSPLTATYSKDEDVWTISGEELDAPLKGSKQIFGPGFSLRIDGQAAAGDTLHLTTLSGAASGMQFLIEKPQQIAAASGLMVNADADNLSDANIIVDEHTPSEKKALPRLDEVLVNSPSP